MSVALELAPYEFVDDGTDDDLSDVDLRHPNFLAAFPDGKVPIREVPYPRLGFGDGFFAWAENVLTLYDRVSPYDVDVLSEAREQIVSYELVGGDQEITLIKWSLEERRKLFTPLMQAGLTLRQLARYLGWHERDVVVALTSTAQACRYQSIVEADELVVEQHFTVRGAATAACVDKDMLTRLERMRRTLGSVAPRAENG